ncbi:MAG: hypothetical protein DPW16_03055 [Chloroflexi bacterium]|nr:hypothetical protein [Chloroflexota bacterium]
MRNLLKLSGGLLGIGTLIILGGIIISLMQADGETDASVAERATPTAMLPQTRAADVPALPFPDNPDPSQCGIPVVWGSANNQAWLNGIYQGEMVQPVVYLYDSHLRRKIVAQAPHGTEVEIILFQPNPVLDYYLVKILGAPVGQNEGWIPAPFLSFKPEVFG